MKPGTRSLGRVNPQTRFENYDFYNHIIQSKTPSPSLSISFYFFLISFKVISSLYFGFNFFLKNYFC
jgi:hypothetical protein